MHSKWGTGIRTQAFWQTAPLTFSFLLISSLLFSNSLETAHSYSLSLPGIPIAQTPCFSLLFHLICSLFLKGLVASLWIHWFSKVGSLLLESTLACYLHCKMIEFFISRNAFIFFNCAWLFFIVSCTFYPSSYLWILSFTSLILLNVGPGL